MEILFQYLKALSPILVKVSGNVTEVKAVQPIKASSAISVNPLERVTEVNCLQFKILLKFALIKNILQLIYAQHIVTLVIHYPGNP